MDSTNLFEELSKAIAKTIEEHVSRSKKSAEWLHELKRPILRVDAFLEDQGPDRDEEEIPSRPFQLASVRTSCLSIVSFVTSSNISPTDLLYRASLALACGNGQ